MEVTWYSTHLKYTRVHRYLFLLETSSNSLHSKLANMEVNSRLTSDCKVNKTAGWHRHIFRPITKFLINFCK